MLTKDLHSALLPPIWVYIRNSTTSCLDYKRQGKSDQTPSFRLIP